MTQRKPLAKFLAAALLAAVSCGAAHADEAALERARKALAAGNAKQAYGELEPLQQQMTGTPEYDYLLGVSALDSGRIDEAIIAFERVLALIPNHAGAQMDLARAYYAAGSFDLAEAAFEKLRAANPPPAAQQAIERYLEAIRNRKRQTQAGGSLWGELGLGYDSNITGVPADFGAAAQQSFNLSGIQPTGNSLKRHAAFVAGALGGEYDRPIGRGFSLFAGGEGRGRVYRHESDFDIESAEVHGGAALNDGVSQWRALGSFAPFWQRGAAPGEPKPKNDRRMGGLGLDWRRALDSKSQVGLGLQFNAVRFPSNAVEDFNQAYLSASWLRSFERPGVPMIYLSAFATSDRANHSFDNGVAGTSTRSKNLGGVRSYLQYSITPKLQVFNGLGVVHRRDRDAFARSTEVEKGRDWYGEASLGLAWEFRDKCTMRLQVAYTRNDSNVDIYDFNRTEISSVIRCEMY